MPVGTPKRVTDEFERRGELVRVSVQLERGALEDLQVLCRHHYGDQSRSAVIRRAVGLLLAREAAQVVRAHAIELRRAQRDAEEVRAVAIAREDRDRERARATLAGALEVAGRRRGRVG